MARHGTLRRGLAALAALFTTALSAGCVSMPTGGPVQSYPVTQGTGAPNQPNVQFQPQPPGNGWNPSQIVEGFLAASAAFGANGQVVQQYLTSQAWNSWKNSWSALVYKSGPNVTPATYPRGVTHPTSATVGITGTIQANLQGSGSYSVPSASSQDGADAPADFQLEKVGGQWRIAYAPPELLLTSNSFQNDYQLRNLYFFDPLGKYLVPDPVYVPVTATQGDLMHGLVQDLITPPADDWLSGGATKTALPKGTKITAVALNGVTAVVNLTGTIAKANSETLEQVSAQLWSTLSSQGGANGQPVQSVEVLRNGQPWVPPTKSNPVQPDALYHPAQGSSSAFYYVDSAGYLVSRTAGSGQAKRLAKIGTGYTEIAVSPDGDYAAALRGHTLYGGAVGGPLAERGTGYVALSWDVNDNLWTSTGERIVMFRASAGTRQPLGAEIPVTVSPPSLESPVEPPFTNLRVAPDGVRVAIVEADGTLLTFGAISGEQTPNPKIKLSTVAETPPQSASAGATFTGLSWYGSDDVVTLATGPMLTEYPVSGGSPASIPADSGMETIAASSGQPLITSLPHALIASNASLSGSWMVISANNVPVSGRFPTYPG